MEEWGGKERRKTHTCDHEEEITLLKERYVNMEDKLELVRVDVKAILALLQGDSERPGLLTKTELIKHSLNRVWWFLGIASTITVAAIIKHLFGGN